MCSFTPNKLGTFEDVLFVKAPKGLRMVIASNYIATNIEVLNRDTTGEWQECHFRFDIKSGENKTGGHVYFTILSGAEIPEQFDIYLGAATVLDITDNPDFFYTPLFDPSLGARMTPGGLLHSESFVEDSALSSVQILRGGGRFSLRLKNLLYQYDTSEWKFHNGWGFYYFLGTSYPVGTRLYMRAQQKHSYSSNLSDFILRGGSRNKYSQKQYLNIVPNEVYDMNHLAVVNVESEIFFETGCHPNTQDVLDTIRVRHCMYLDLTELYEKLPGFKALSDAEQLERLNRLPWFPNEYELSYVTEDLYLY